MNIIISKTLNANRARHTAKQNLIQMVDESDNSDIQYNIGLIRSNIEHAVSMGCMDVFITYASLKLFNNNDVTLLEQYLEALGYTCAKRSPDEIMAGLLIEW